MRMISLPSNQIFKYVLTGKFVAPSEEWKHENFFLGEYELIVMTEGTLYLTYNHENFIVTSGQYLLLPPCNAWRQGFQSAYCAFYWLHFSVDSSTGTDSNAQNTPSDLFSIPQMGTIPNLDKMVVLMKQLQDSVKNHYPLMVIGTMATCVVTELYGQLTLQVPADLLQSSRKQIYSDITDYIRLHISENIRVADIAAQFGYNAKYLSHQFVKITGYPLKQFILNQKIDSANFMLSDTNQSIAEIAAALGFTDSHNFCRAYKRATGLTPTQYRNAFAKRMLFHR